MFAFHMKNYLNLIQVFFCLIIFCFSMVGQPLKGASVPQKYSVTYFSAQNGVEDGLVNDIIQDHKGLLWFATWNGLYRFDGYSFKNYKSNTEDAKGLTNDRLLQLSEDKQGSIWVLCYDSTCYRFNPNREKFEPILQGMPHFRSIQVLSNGIVWLLRKDGSAIRVSTRPDDLSMTFRSYSFSDGTLPFGKIQSVFIDSKYREWILTDHGLYQLHPSRLSMMLSAGSQTAEPIAFYCATEQSGELFFGADQGKIYKYSLTGKQLECRQLRTSAAIISIQSTPSQRIYVTDKDGFFIQTSPKEVKHITLDPLTSLKDKTIESAQITSNHLLWLVHPVPGVSLFNMQTQQLSFIEGKDESGKALDTESGFFSFEDKNGVLWVHPKGGGFSYYDPQGKELVGFNTTDQPVKWKSNDRCFTAFADKQGNLWMSTQLNRLKRVTFTPDKFHIYTPAPQDIELPDNEIRALYIDRENRLWTGDRNHYVSVYDAQLRLLHRLKLGKVYAIMQDADGSYWLSTKGEGLIKATETTQGKYDIQRFTHHSGDPFSLSSNNVYFTFQDSKKRIWIATYGGGINLIENLPNGSLRFISHRNLLKKYPIDRFYKVRHITEDAKGRIWVSTTAGILLFDEVLRNPERITFHSICREQGNIHSLSNNDVQMIKCMEDGKVFAITYGGGLNELLSTGIHSYKCKAFTQKNGLISDIIYSMHEDKSGNLWLVTGGGLVKFIASQEQIQYPSEHIASQMHFSEGVGATNGKEIFFGTNRGLFYFTPEEIHKTDFVPRIFFSAVWVNNQELNSLKTPAVLAASPDDTPRLTLPPNNHSLRLVFSALDMADTEYIQYAYMLEGFDEKFRLTDNGHEANYTNLPPGEYKFHVKSTNNEGVWVDNGRTLSIEVLPTFFETPYATVLYVVLVLLVILSGIYIFTVFYRIKNKVKNEELMAQLKLSFFTNVSHELRTPLTLITGPLEYILQDESLSGNMKHTLNIIKKNSDRMQRLVGQILDFSKIQGRKMRLRVQYVNIVDFTQDVIGYFTAFANERQINLTFTAEASSCCLWLDTDNIEKVIFNLLSNAFKYTPDGKNIHICITESADSVLIQIADEGVGIKKEKQETIFDRFENLAQSNRHTTLSSGIGLSLAKELVEMHQGSISVESEPGKGSIFSVRLLKGKSHYSAETEFILSDLDENRTLEESYSEIQPQEMSHTDKVRILIVEDNRELRTFIKQIFREKFQIIEAENGEEGLRKAISDLPDIVITDIMMPVKDGLQMLQELRDDERTSHIPAIVLTAKADMDSMLTGIHTGADDYITKPFSMSYLQAKVESLLAQRRMLQTYYCKASYTATKELQKEKEVPQLSEKDAAFLEKLSLVMEQQMSNSELCVDQLVSYFNLSRTNFFHKLKALTNLSPVLYIREVRMRRAAELIKENQYSMAEVGYMVGFGDPHYFSKSFKAYWGMTATEFAKNPIID